MVILTSSMSRMTSIEIDALKKIAQTATDAYNTASATAAAVNSLACKAKNNINFTIPDTPEYYEAVDLAKATYKASTYAINEKVNAAKTVYTAVHAVANATGIDGANGTEAYVAASSTAYALIEAEEEAQQRAKDKATIFAAIFADSDDV